MKSGQHILAWRLGYVAVVVLATLLESGITLDAGHAATRFERAFHPALTGRDAIDAVRNVLLFGGWGVVWTLTARSGRIAVVAIAAGTGLLLSTTVEALQLFATKRTASVLDLGTNTLGAALGAAVTVSLATIVGRRRGARSYLGIPMLLFGLAYGGAALLEAVSPLFRQSHLSGAWGGPLERFRVAWATMPPESWRELSLLDVFLFAPVGAFAVAALAERGRSYRTAAILVTLIAIPAAFGAEFARGFVGYWLAWGPPVVHALAITAGAWVAVRILPAATRALRGAHRPLALYMLYVPLLALWSVRPLVPETSFASVIAKLHPVRFVPLLAYRERVDLFTAADALAPALLYFPLGCLLAVWPLRLRGAMRQLLPAFALAAILEGSQILIAARFFDVTDILIQGAGAALGFILVRRAGYRPYGSVLDAARALSRAG